MMMIFAVGVALLINSVIVTAICPDPGPDCNCTSLGPEWSAVSDNCNEGGCMMKFDGPNTTFTEALDACIQYDALGSLGSHLMTWNSESCFDDLGQWLICEHGADPDHTNQWWTAGGEDIPNAVKKGNAGKKWIDIVFEDGTVENIIVKIEGSANGKLLKYGLRAPSAKDGYICMAYCDDCGSGPCQHDAVCNNHGNSYTCICSPGYTGTNCETDINECEPEPCQHGGTCRDGVDSYQCDCAPGYTGTNCETDINECEPEPCQHGGTCTDGVNSYECQCAPGYVDTDCETECVKPATGEVKSHGGGKQISGLFFMNHSGRTITLYWLNYDGEYVSVGDIESGQQQGVNTFVGHAWIALDKKNNVIRINKQCVYFPKENEFEAIIA